MILSMCELRVLTVGIAPLSRNKHRNRIYMRLKAYLLIRAQGHKACLTALPPLSGITRQFKAPVFFIVDGLLGKHAHKGDNGIIGFTIVGDGGREVGNQISRDVRPWARGNGVGLKEARGSLS